MADYDLFGNIAIIKGEGKTKSQKISEAKELLKKNSIKTIVEKIGNVSGRLRTIKIKHVLGEKNTIAVLKENNCTFKLDIEDCYFSPRLSNDRKNIAEKINPNDKLLVMFAGVGPYPIVIYKLKRPKRIVAVELGRECCKYFLENLKINKISDKDIEVIQGDVKKKVATGLGKFDVIIMARPNLKTTFLKQALIVSKKGTRIFYHGFSRDNELQELVETLINEASGLKRKIKLIETIAIGEIAPYKHRFRIEFKVIK